LPKGISNKQHAQPPASYLLGAVAGLLAMTTVALLLWRSYGLLALLLRLLLAGCAIVVALPVAAGVVLEKENAIHFFSCLSAFFLSDRQMQQHEGFDVAVPRRLASCRRRCAVQERIFGRGRSPAAAAGRIRTAAGPCCPVPGDQQALKRRQSQSAQ